MEKTDESGKFEVRHNREWLCANHERDWDTIKTVVRVLQKIKSFCRTKKNKETKKAIQYLQHLRQCMESNDYVVQ